MSDPTTSTPASSEEIRREMKSRFDAVNEAAEDGHQRRRDAGDLASKEAVRGAASDPNPGPADDAGNIEGIRENDSLGG